MSKARQETLLDITPEMLPDKEVIAGDTVLPVAQVLVKTHLAHLDSPFDYLIPPELDQVAQVGALVKVTLAGKLQSGWIISRSDRTSFSRKLIPLKSVISKFPILTPQMIDLAKSVAQRYCGLFSDALESSYPTRQVRVEEKFLQLAPPTLSNKTQCELNQWYPYRGGTAFIDHLHKGRSPWAVWNALPQLEADFDHWGKAIVQACSATINSGRSVLILVPTKTLSMKVTQLISTWLPGEPIIEMRNEKSISKRYGAYLSALLGHGQIAVGTQKTVFAPLSNLGLIAVWDDGNSNYQSRNAPYFHSREVAILRAKKENCALLIGGFIRTVQAQRLLKAKVAHELEADRNYIRQNTPRVSAPSEQELEREGAGGYMRFPLQSYTLIKQALKNGPVLVQVPIRGWARVIACVTCTSVARCQHCGGPLEINNRQNLACSWCGVGVHTFECATCSGTKIRAIRIGSDRTGAELGWAFKGIPVTISSSDHLVEEVSKDPRIVVATPGAEPKTEAGYSAVVIIDALSQAGRPELGAPQEALRKWANALACSQAQAPGIILGRPGMDLGQIMVRWDFSRWAERALAERDELAFPPVARIFALSGPTKDIKNFLNEFDQDIEILGPVSVGNFEDRVLLRCDLRQADQVSTEIMRVMARRSARKETKIKIEVDPGQLV